MPNDSELSSTPTPTDSTSQALVPTYRITRAADQTLIFDPPVGSRSLADALSYHYPFHEGLQRRIRQASLDYFLSCGKDNPLQSIPNPSGSSSSQPSRDVLLHPSSSVVSIAPKPIQSSTHSESTPPQANSDGFTRLRVESTANPHFKPKVWDIKTGKPSTRRSRGRKSGSALKPEERQRVAKNRGNACARHRRARTKVYLPM